MESKVVEIAQQQILTTLPEIMLTMEKVITLDWPDEQFS